MNHFFKNGTYTVVAGGATLACPRVLAYFLNRLQTESVRRLYDHLLGNTKTMAKVLSRAGFATGL